MVVIPYKNKLEVLDIMKVTCDRDHHIISANAGN